MVEPAVSCPIGDAHPLASRAQVKLGHYPRRLSLRRFFFRLAREDAITGACYSAGTVTIATARDSWSRMLPPPPGLRAPGREQALVRASALPLALLRPPAAMLPDRPPPQRASFSSPPASLAPPLAGSREPGWVRAAARQSRPPPPDAPTRSAAGSRSAQASRRTRYRAGPRADRACDSSAPTRFSLLPLAVRTRGPASRAAEPSSSIAFNSVNCSSAGARRVRNSATVSSGAGNG
jgi:hypothetical protein